jgi:O-antigen/teichoic acid export membrane protein
METQKNVFYNVLLALSQVLFPLITFPYLARTLGPNQIGLLNFAESISRYFILVAALGIPIYGVREIAKRQENKLQRTMVFLEIASINLITTILLTIAFICIVFCVPKMHSELPLFGWAIVYFILQMFYFEWFFTGMNQFKFIALRSFVIRFLFILFVFLLIKSKSDYLKYMQMQVSLSMIIALINFKYLYSLLDLKKINIVQLNLKQHLKPLFLLFLTIFSISIYFSMDTILLGFLANNESVGYYSSALKLTKLIIAVLGSISVALFPQMINLYHNGGEEQFSKMVKQCYALILSLSIPLVILIAGLADDIIILLLGQHFNRAILPLQITAPLIVIVSLSGIFGFQVLSALSKDKAILFSAIVGMLVSILLSFFLVPNYMENGEAITILVTELSVCLSFIYFSNKYFSLNGYGSIFIKQLIEAIPYLLVVISVKFFTSYFVYHLLLTSLLSIIWFCVLHFYIHPNSIYKTQLMRILNKIRVK